MRGEEGEWHRGPGPEHMQEDNDQQYQIYLRGYISNISRELTLKNNQKSLVANLREGDLCSLVAEEDVKSK